MSLPRILRLLGPTETLVSIAAIWPQSQVSGRDADQKSVSRSLACGALAEEWAKTLDRQNEVVWLEKDSNPLPRIRKDGIRIADGTGSDGFIPLTQLRYEDVYGLKVDILNGDRKVLTISSGVKNFFVGETLITNVLRKQQAAFGATNG